MNKELEKTLSRIIEQEELAREFSQLDDMDEMYRYCCELGGGYTEEEFDEGIAEVIDSLKSEESKTNLSDEDLKYIAGGMNFNGLISKTAAVMLSALTLGSATFLPNTKAAEPSANTEKTQSISEDLKSDVSDKWSKTKGVLSNLWANYKGKIIATTAIAILAVAGTSAWVYKHKKDLAAETANDKDKKKQPEAVLESKGEKEKEPASTESKQESVLSEALKNKDEIKPLESLNKVRVKGPKGRRIPTMNNRSSKTEDETPFSSSVGVEQLQPQVEKEASEEAERKQLQEIDKSTEELEKSASKESEASEKTKPALGSIPETQEQEVTSEPQPEVEEEAKKAEEQKRKEAEEAKDKARALLREDARRKDEEFEKGVEGLRERLKKLGTSTSLILKGSEQPEVKVTSEDAEKTKPALGSIPEPQKQEVTSEPQPEVEKEAKKAQEQKRKEAEEAERKARASLFEDARRTNEEAQEKLKKIRETLKSLGINLPSSLREPEQPEVKATSGATEKTEPALGSIPEPQKQEVTSTLQTQVEKEASKEMKLSAEEERLKKETELKEAEEKQRRETEDEYQKAAKISVNEPKEEFTSSKSEPILTSEPQTQTPVEDQPEIAAKSGSVLDEALENKGSKTPALEHINKKRAKGPAGRRKPTVEKPASKIGTDTSVSSGDKAGESGSGTPANSGNNAEEATAPGNESKPKPKGGIGFGMFDAAAGLKGLKKTK